MSLRKALKGNKGQRKKRTAMLLLLALGIGCARPIAADVIGDAQKEKENAQANLNECTDRSKAFRRRKTVCRRRWQAMMNS